MMAFLNSFLFVCFSCLSYSFRHLQSHGTGHTFFKTMCWLQLDIIWAICVQVKWIGSSLKIMGLIANLEILFYLTYFFSVAIIKYTQKSSIRRQRLIVVYLSRNRPPWQEMRAGGISSHCISTQKRAVNTRAQWIFSFLYSPVFQP